MVYGINLKIFLLNSFVSACFDACFKASLKPIVFLLMEQSAIVVVDRFQKWSDPSKTSHNLFRIPSVKRRERGRVWVLLLVPLSSIVVERVW
jgi:hypothetical protein